MAAQQVGAKSTVGGDRDRDGHEQEWSQTADGSESLWKHPHFHGDEAECAKFSRKTEHCIVCVPRKQRVAQDSGGIPKRLERTEYRPKHARRRHVGRDQRPTLRCVDGTHFATKRLTLSLAQAMELASKRGGVFIAVTTLGQRRFAA